MWTYLLTPAVYDTDALGHVNNTRMPQWFERARDPVFEIFTPDLGWEHWRIIIARIEVDYEAQISYGTDVEIRTWIEKIGHTSFTVHHECRQHDVVAAVGKAVLVNYDFQNKRPVPLTEADRAALREHLMDGNGGTS